MGDVTIIFSTQLGLVIFSEMCLTCTFPKAMICSRVCVGILAFSSGIVGLLFRSLGVASAQTKHRVDSDFCDPWSSFQPHALWHVLTGLALLGLNEVQLGPFSFPWSVASEHVRAATVGAQTITGSTT